MPAGGGRREGFMLSCVILMLIALASAAVAQPAMVVGFEGKLPNTLVIERAERMGMKRCPTIGIGTHSSRPAAQVNDPRVIRRH
jgi:hypothetical protein